MLAGLSPISLQISIMSESRTSSRPIQSCFQCRKRKIKCSKSYPCTPCILRGEGDACREVDKAQLQEHRKSCERIEELVDRIQKLENTISVLSSRGSPSNEESPRSIRRRELSSTPYSKSPSPVSKRRSCSRNLCSPVPTLLRTGSRDEEVALILEDFVMGRKVNQTRAVDGHCVSPYNTPSMSSENHPINGLNSNPWSLWVNSPPEFVSRLSPILPNHPRIQLLLQFYVQRLDWYAKVLHVPSFLAKSNAILTHINNHRFELVDVGFLGVLLAVLCLSFHFADAPLCEQLFLDYSACSEYAQQLYTGAQACLQYSNFTGSQTLEHLQNIILTGVYQQNNDESDSQWALTGAAIKIAQNLGMSRLGSETGLHQYPLEWRSSIKREVARRVWWCLVLNDWSCAMAHQGVYSIHPSQNHTSLPANIDDVDLGESDVVQSKPPNIHTEMSSFLCRLRFIDIQRQLVDESNRGGYDLDFVNDMEYKINNVISDLNDHFQMVLDSRKKPSRPNDARCSERTLCQIIGQGLILQLNRPFLFRSYHDKRYVQARSQCIKAARLILQHLNANLQGERLLRWSIPVSNAFAASIVLFIDLCHLRCNGANVEIGKCSAELQSALRLFRSVGQQAPTVTRNASHIIEQMLAAEVSLFAERRSDLDLDGDSNFERIARRIIVNTSQGKCSNMGHLLTPVQLNTPLTLSPEPRWDSQFLDVNNSLPSGILLNHDHDIFPGGGIPFHETSSANTSFVPAEVSITYFK